MKRSNYAIAAIILIAGLFFSTQSSASEKLYYAGIAYMGNESAKDVLYKYSSRLIEDEDRFLQQTLINRLRDINNESFEIVFDEFVDYKKSDALTLAIAIEYENVSTEKIGSDYKADIDLRVNILIFDHREMKVVSTYPIAVQLRDAFRSKPSEEELKKTVGELYFDNKLKVNIFDEVVRRLSSLDLKHNYSNTIKVSKVTITDQSKSNIPNIASSGDEENYEVFLAQMFSAYLSKNQNVSVLPYTKGHAIGKRMTGRLANGDAFNLAIPEETYSIELDLFKLKKANLTSNEYKSVWGYASYFRVRLLIPGYDEALMDAKFRGLVKKSILLSSPHTVEDWSIYKESMYRLFDGLTKNISKRDKTWLANVTATKNINKQLKTLNEKILSCKLG